MPNCISTVKSCVVQYILIIIWITDQTVSLDVKDAEKTEDYSKLQIWDCYFPVFSSGIPFFYFEILVHYDCFYNLAMVKKSWWAYPIILGGI